MPSSLSQSFDDFVRALEPTAEQDSHAQRQSREVAEALREALQIDEIFISGSYGRRTAIKPLHDVDLFVVLNDAAHRQLRSEEAERCVQEIQKVLQRRYPNQVSVRPQRRSANVTFADTDIGFDIVPAFHIDDDVYIIPDVDRGTWIKTNPKRHAALLKQANRRAGEKLNPLIKAAKHWNAKHGKNLRSFHLEVMSYEAFSSAPSSYPEGLAKLFEYLAERIKAGCPDPAGLGPKLDRNLSAVERDQLAGQLKNAAKRFEDALALDLRGDDNGRREAKEVYFSEFGDLFPRP